MEDNQYSNPFWTCLVIDKDMKILEIINLDDKLFFGKDPIYGNTINNSIGKENHEQAEIIIKYLNKTLLEKRNTSFVYLSNYANNKSTYVCGHTEYRNNKTVCLYLTALNTNDLHDIQEKNNSKSDEYIEFKRKHEGFYNQNISIFNLLPLGIGLYSKDGVLLYANETNYRILGLDYNETTKSLVNINNSPVISQEIKDAVRRGLPIHQQIPYRFCEATQKGYINTQKTETRFIDCNGKPILNTDGEYDSYIFIIDDITEKIKNEETLRLNRNKTEIAMKASDIMFWEFDVQLKLFYSDNEPLNGYDQSKPVTIDQYMETIHPDNKEMVYEFMEQAIAGEDISFSFDLRVLLPDNPEWQYCTVNGSPCQYDTDGKVNKYVGTRKNNTLIHKRKLLQDKILNSLPISIHIKDVKNDHRYVFCNDESKRMFGTSEDKTTYDVLDVEEVERIRKTDLEVYNTGKPYLGSERITMKDGRSYDTIVRKSVIDDEGKRLLLTTRWEQSSQNDMKRRSQLLTLTMEAMDAFTWLYEPEKERINYGDGISKIGRRSSEINTLKKYIACLHPDDVQLFKDSLKNITEKENGTWEMTYRLDFNNDGTYKWWETRGIMETTIVNDVPYKYMYGMTICVDPHKRAEEALLKNEKELNQLIHQNELILNNTNSGLAYITTDYIVQWENISTCSTSLSLEAYKKGEHCYKSAHNRTSPCENCILQRCIVSHQTELIQFALDNEHKVEIFATPVFKEDKTLDGIVIRVDDITEREKMIEELKQAKMLAEQSDKLKSAFLANMSHEIRTPLNAIIGFSELLMNTNEEEEKEQYISIINNNNELLLKLINDILDLSKIEAGSVEFKYEEFDLAEYFDDMVTSMRQRVTKPNIRLIAENSYTNCKVYLDKNRVAQLMTNYVTNAIKYTPKGFIEMGYECVEKGIRFYVKDTGIGISDDKKDKVFHRFAKLDEFAQGTGLGLSICKAITESMGGSVGFESQYGEGSLFWFFLPCDPQTANVTEKNNESHAEVPTNVTVGIETGSDKQRQPERKTILIAEDIQSNYLLLSAILQKHFNLLHAENGQEAVEMAQNNDVDLILMDMKMPVMDGLTATAEIRKVNAELPIIALTAHAFESDRIAALASGCNEYLVKPVDKALLMSVLQKYCFKQLNTIGSRK